MGLESAKSSGKTIGFPLIQKVGAFFDLLYSGYRRYGIAEIGK